MPHSKTLHIHSIPGAVRQARVFAATNLRRWGVTGAIEDATLVVSELVTNAVKASTDGDDVAVWLWTDGESVLIEVRDRTPGIPLVVEATADEDSGRGLFLVAAISKDWGAVPADTGKVVWAFLGSADSASWVVHAS